MRSDDATFEEDDEEDAASFALHSLHSRGLFGGRARTSETMSVQSMSAPSLSGFCEGDEDDLDDLVQPMQLHNSRWISTTLARSADQDGGDHVQRRATRRARCRQQAAVASI